jgi:hypothetical protein
MDCTLVRWRRYPPMSAAGSPRFLLHDWFGEEQSRPDIRLGRLSEALRTKTAAFPNYLPRRSTGPLVYG